MPELPEVETVVRDLRPLLCGKEITRVVNSGARMRLPWKKEWSTLLQGQKVERLNRRGKWILIDLSKGECLIIHLGMTGQLCVFPGAEPLQDHTHLIFSLGNGAFQLRFRDVRRFGSAEVVASAQVEGFFLRKKIGPEPFGVDQSYWLGRLMQSSRNLKAILLDQQILSGVGNIYADESLFDAGLHPERPGKSLTEKEALKLSKSIEKVLKKAIEKRGSTIRDYVGGSRLEGEFQDEFKVYGRDGEPCKRCKSLILRKVLAGRSSHFCPICQPMHLPRR